MMKFLVNSNENRLRELARISFSFTILRRDRLGRASFIAFF